MLDPLPFVHVSAEAFLPLPHEDDLLVNDGMYGKALCDYLQPRLQAQGYTVPFVCNEDWGWWVEVAGFPVPTGVCVYAVGSTPETYCVTVSPNRGRQWSWRRFRWIDTTEIAERLHGAVVVLFEADPDVTILGFPAELPFAEDAA